MGKRRHIQSIALPACGMMMLILDSQTAIRGASEGIALCIRSVIPSLFPFFLLSGLLINSILNGDYQDAKASNTPPLFRQPVITIFLAGLLGGYPTGAQAVADAYNCGQISRNTARRLLGFCSNAGPAFIFGITSHLFSAPYMCWAVLGIHIFSALVVSLVIPVQHSRNTTIKSTKKVSVQQAFNRSLHTIAAVCGWIVLFRVLIAFLDRWFLWLFPPTVGILISGILELANGIFLLANVEAESIRFICCCVLISFGGLCVGMQTASVTKYLGMGWYFPGKLMQSAISGMLAVFFANSFYSFPVNGTLICVFFTAAAVCSAVMLIVRKFPVAFLENCVYNGQKPSKELLTCSSVKK